MENSEHPVKNRVALQNFLTGVQLLPIVQALDVFAKKQAHLRRARTIIDDFDLLMGATAVAHGLTLYLLRFDKQHFG